MSQCRGVAAFNGRYVEPVRSSVLGQERKFTDDGFGADQLA